ncbi:hypothetical protein FI667_g8108, partial [Globisporangium splendens]
MDASAPLQHRCQYLEQQQMMVLVLSQIHARVERQRGQSAASSSLRHDDSPMSLIELVEASYSVFERYGIGTPEDAEYHRCLLSLSIDPDRDWRRKIERFTASMRPQVVKRLCRFSKTHTATPSPARVEAADKTLKEAEAQRETRHSSGNYQSQTHPRRLSTSDSRDEPGAVTPLAFSPKAAHAGVRFVRSPLSSPSSAFSARRSNDDEKPRDHFSDMLSFQPSNTVKASRRTAIHRPSLQENMLHNAATLAQEPQR